MTRLYTLIALARAALTWSLDDTPRELDRLRQRVRELEQANHALEQEASTHRVLWKAQQKTVEEWRRVVERRSLS